MALAASFVSTRVYYASDTAEPVMEEGQAWTIVGSLSAGWMCVFAAFLLLMKRPYLGTFFSFQSGHAWAKENFITGDTDELKAWTLGCNKKQWMSIRPDVKAWTMENWERWEDEKPPFFTDAWKASVDDDMIPPANLRKLMKGGASSRRRSSLGDILGAGTRVAPVISGREEHAGGEQPAPVQALVN